jgi:hypothetical protein
LGEKIMKEIMAGESSDAPEGVASLSFRRPGIQPALPLELDHPLKELAGRLLSRFAGSSLTVIEIYRLHGTGNQPRLTNYKEALKLLAASGKIKCSRNRPWTDGSMPDDVLISFPKD